MIRKSWPSAFWPKVVLLVLLSFAALSATAAPVRLTSAMFPAGQSSNPTTPYPLGSIAIFTAWDPVFGRELWKTDGTLSGTVMIKDIHAGNGGAFNDYSVEPHFAVMGNAAYFSAFSPGAGEELWKTDGTTNGTVMVKELVAGETSGASGATLLAVGSRLFIGVADGLWVSDGTPAGTMKLETFDGLGSMTAVGNTLYFAGNQAATTGVELWKSDGTDAGTVLVLDIDPGLDCGDESNVPCSGNPWFLTAMGTDLYFSARDPAGGDELFEYDTTAGTHTLHDLVPGSTSSSALYLTKAGSTLYFAAIDDAGQELWKTDGSAPTRVSDVCPGSCNGFGMMMGTLSDGSLLLSAYDGTGTGLWRSNGTAQGTTVVRSPLSLTTNGLDLRIGSHTYFIVYIQGSSATYQLWKTDGTDAGTSMVTSLGSPSRLTVGVFGATLLLNKEISANNFELWKSDGTPGGTTLLKNIAEDVTGASPQKFVNLGSTGAIFSGISDVGYLSLWQTDSSPQATSPFSSLYIVQHMAVAGSTTFVAAADMNLPDVGYELFKLNGTTSTLVKDIRPGPESSQLGFGTVMNGILYFVAHDGAIGYEVWRSDGTTGGTYPIGDVLGPNDGQPGEFAVMNGNLFFGAAQKLFKYDGTTATAIAEYTAGTPYHLRAVNGKLFFAVGGEIWTSDGTTTAKLKDGFGIVYTVGVLGNLYMFTAESVAEGAELWKSDGTEGGTQIVLDIAPGADYGFPYNFTVVGSTMYFTAWQAATGYELWKTNGSAATTTIVDDKNPGPGSSSISELVAGGGRLYFGDWDAVAGNELWTSDGTAAGTMRVADIEPGTGGSAPSRLTVLGSRLFFAATTSTHSTQAYVMCAGLPAQLQMSASSASAIAAAPFTLTLTPVDSGSNPTCYDGTLHFTATPPGGGSGGSVPNDYTFGAAESSHDFTFTLPTLGVWTITATDTVSNTVTGMFLVTVRASPEESTISALPASVPADGSSTATVTVQLKDANGSNLSTGAATTLTLSSTAGAISGLTNNNNGTWTATLLAPNTPANATISGELNGVSMTSTATVVFTGPATQFTVTAPATTTSGTQFSVTVTARDANGSIAEDFNGTVSFSSSDPSATLPSPYAFQPSDDGVHTFTNVRLTSVGSRTITATSSSITGSATVAVSGTTSTTVSSSPNPSNGGTTVTFTAAVSSAAPGAAIGGTVEFRAGGNPIGTANVSEGVATLFYASLATGSHSITAVYSGDANFLTSTSPTHTHTVGIYPPANFIAAYNGTAVQLSWSAVQGAVQYEVLKSTAVSVFSTLTVTTGTSFTDTAVDPNRTYVYRVRGIDASATTGPRSTDAATTMLFLDDPLVPGTTKIKAQHLVEIRTGINAIRAYAGLGPASYTRAIAAGMIVSLSDVTETRTQLSTARNMAGLSLLGSDPSVAGGFPVKASHFAEMRLLIK